MVEVGVQCKFCVLSSVKMMSDTHAQNGLLGGDVLPPYSEVDVQGGGGGGGRVVTQGDRLNALKRERAHRHHTRISSSDRLTIAHVCTLYMYVIHVFLNAVYM